MRLPLTVVCPASVQSVTDRRQLTRERERETTADSCASDRQTTCSCFLHTHTHTLFLSGRALALSRTHFVLYLAKLPTGIFLFSAVNRFWRSLGVRSLKLTPPKLRCHCGVDVAVLLLLLLMSLAFCTPTTDDVVAAAAASSSSDHRVCS